MVRCDGAGLGRSGCMRAWRVRVLRARRYASLCAGVRRYAGGVHEGCAPGGCSLIGWDSSVHLPVRGSSAREPAGRP